jgi:Mn-dependent DtxR family transcriptional regulator
MKGGGKMGIQESGEMYLESIYVLTKSRERVRSIDVCEHMGYSKPSVSRAVSNLKKAEYITVNEEGHISLTERGMLHAKKIFERHTLLTELLIRLGVAPEIAAADACKIEHHISDESFEALKKHAEQYK